MSSAQLTPEAKKKKKKKLVAALELNIWPSDQTSRSRSCPPSLPLYSALALACQQCISEPAEYK